MVRVPAIIKSVVFHVAIVAGFVVTMPYLSRDIAPEQPVLTVDIVNTVDETNLDEGVEAKAKPKPQPVKEVEAEEKPTPPPPAPPPPAPAPAPEPPAPEPPAPEEVKVADAVPVPSEKPKAAPKPPKAKPAPTKLSAPPKRPTKKSPEFKKRQQQQAQLTSKLQDLTERKKQQRRAEQEKEKKKQEAKAKLNKLLEKQAKKKQDTADADRQEAEEKIEDLIGQALNTPRKTSGALGATVIDQLRNHLAICWSPPPGAAGADSLIVDIIVRLNNRAEVQDVEIVDKARMNRDSTFKAAARAARRAVVDCSPLPLPLDNHDTWKELQFEFDPRFITRS